jgi:hypothetical protein
MPITLKRGRFAVSLQIKMILIQTAIKQSGTHRNYIGFAWQAGLQVGMQRSE